MGDEVSKPQGQCGDKHLDNDNTFSCEDGTCMTRLCKHCAASVPGKKGRFCYECVIAMKNRDPSLAKSANGGSVAPMKKTGAVVSSGGFTKTGSVTVD